MAVQQDFRVKKGLFVNESSNVVGNSAVGGNMTITGTMAVSNNTTMGGTLNVSRATTLSNTLAVVGTTTVTGATTLANTLNTTGAVSLANTLRVTGATTLSSTLLVQGASTVNNTLTVAGTISTTGATTLSNTLSVVGATTLSSTLSTSGVATFANTLSATGATTLSNTLSTSGAATFLNTLLVQGATTVNNNLVVANTLTVTRAATLANTLGVTGAATFANTLSVTGALTVGGNLTVSGSLTYINTTALNIGDAVIALNADLGAVAPTENAGLEVNRGTSANSYIYWNETNDRWEATGNASLAAANSEIHIGGTGPSNYTVDNSNGSVLQDVALTFDSFGHVRTVATTTANLDTRYLSFSSVVSGGVTVAADLYNDTLTLANGAGIAVSADATTDTITFSHYDTSSAASIAIDNSGGTVLQDVAVTLDAYGHVTAVSAASANLDTRYSQLSFSTLAVSGQSNVVADAIADTLILAGNNGITVTTNATSDTITFTGPSTIPAWTTARTLTLGGDLTGNVTFDGSANFTLTAAVNDGSGSGLDADLLDGQDGAYYRNATNINAGTLDKARLPASVDANTTGNAATATKLATARTINGVAFDGSANITITANTTNTLTLGTGLTGTSFNGSAAVTAAVSYGTTAGTACQGNDSRLSDSRPANGGNSDTVDNLHASSFLRSDAGTTFSGGVLQVTTPAGSLGSNTGPVNTLQIYQATLNTDAFQTFHIAGDHAVHFGLDGTTNDLFVGGWSAGAVKNKIWHAGNDGPGSGLVASKVSDIAPSGDGRNLVEATMASNDYFRIRAYSTADDLGEVEIATADGGIEPIHVRQYTGVFASIARTLTLLNENGNTVIPGGVWSIPNNAFLNTVSVITGTVYHGNWLPIPDGYQEWQCRFFISMNNTNPYDNIWDLREGLSTQHYSVYCRLINNRQVEAFTRVYNDVNDSFQYHNGIANYIVIGVK